MKFSLISKALLFGCALGQKVYDLDDTQELAELESSGLQFEGAGAQENLKVASSNGSTGYSWLVDRENCDGIVDITNGYVFNPPAANSTEPGFGEEIFTLTATGPGECKFQIAYAEPSKFVNFEDHANARGLLISIPVEVGSDEQDLEE